MEHFRYARCTVRTRPSARAHPHQLAPYLPATEARRPTPLYGGPPEVRIWPLPGLGQPGHTWRGETCSFWIERTAACPFVTWLLQTWPGLRMFFSVAIFFSSSRAPRSSLARVWRAESAFRHGSLQRVAGHRRQSRRVMSLASRTDPLSRTRIFRTPISRSSHLSGFGGALNPAWRGEYDSRARVIGRCSVSFYRVAVS